MNVCRTPWHPSVLLPALFLFWGAARAQDPTRFKNEVQEVRAEQGHFWNPSRETIVFTGSSSIRMWEGLRESFPGYQILNTGFGGSQASDLLYHLDSLVLYYQPVKIIIYEGDNDIAEGKRPGQVLKTQKAILKRIRQAEPGATLVFLSAKPSISRWHLRRKYRRYNRKLARLARRENNVTYVDVWTPMTDGRNRLNRKLFIEDGLHMNQQGYDLWREVIAPLVENPIKNPANETHL